MCEKREWSRWQWIQQRKVETRRKKDQNRNRNRKIGNGFLDYLLRSARSRKVFCVERAALPVSRDHMTLCTLIFYYFPRTPETDTKYPFSTMLEGYITPYPDSLFHCKSYKHVSSPHKHCIHVSTPPYYTHIYSKTWLPMTISTKNLN